DPEITPLRLRRPIAGRHRLDHAAPKAPPDYFLSVFGRGCFRNRTPGPPPLSLLPFFEAHDLKLLRVLTDRGSEFCGNPERHEYELYLAVEDIDHSRTKTKSPQTNDICERFHKTALNEFYRVAFRKKVYRSTDELQAALDAWIKEYNEAR